MGITDINSEYPFGRHLKDILEVNDNADGINHINKIKCILYL